MQMQLHAQVLMKAATHAEAIADAAADGDVESRWAASACPQGGATFTSSVRTHGPAPQWGNGSVDSQGLRPRIAACILIHG